MPTNLTSTAVYAGEVSVPDEGEEVTAATAGAGKGPVRQAFQKLFDKIKATTLGTVSHKYIAIDATGETAVLPAVPGGLVASTLIFAGTGIQSIAGDIVAAAGRVTAAISHRVAAAAGTADLTQKGVAWTGIANNDDAGPNPTGILALTNDFRALLAPKAWIRLSTDGAGGFTVRDRGNVVGVSLPGGNKIRILLSGVMLNEWWAPCVWGSHTFTLGAEADITPGQIDVTCSVDPQTTVVRLCLHAFGRQ